MDRDACDDIDRRQFRDRELVEERWRGVDGDGRMVACWIYRLHGPGLEVRLGNSAGEFQRIRHVANLAEGRDLAETWRAGWRPRGAE